MRRSRALTGTTAAVLLSSLLLGGAAQAGGASSRVVPAHTVTLTGGLSTFGHQFLPLAGSSR